MKSRKPRTNELPPMTPRRKPRKRPTPKWLVEQQDLDEAARRRCLMILSVLSGERAVTEVIMEAGISRQNYYELETRALAAMLKALVPGSSAESAATTAEKRVVELEQRVKQLQTEKRRAERLLLLTRKVMRTGRRKTTRRASTRTRARSTTRGPRPSTTSKRTAAARSTEATKAEETASTPTSDGAVER
jgi:hypothetical protein